MKIMLNAETIANLKNNEKFAKAVGELYTDANGLEYQLKRYADIYSVHAAKYSSDVLFFSSPGRIELCGNHTDHNNGKVLCASISVDTVACVTPTVDETIIVESYGYPPIKVDLNSLEIDKSLYGKSEALVKGVARYFKDNGMKVGGFTATTSSDVFKGAGVSSSACFEVLIAEILNVLYNGSKLDAITKAKASHYAESVFFGKPCGLLDQSAIALGGVSYIDFKNTKMPKVESIDWNFDDMDIVLTNTGGDHANLTDHYAAIRREMEEVAAILGHKTLRKVSEEKFYASIPALSEKVSGRAILRAMHFFNENKRVVKAAQAIRKASGKKFTECINGSGDSSYMMLQNCYPAEDVKERIPLGIALSKGCDGVKAVRVHGGGFAGTILAFVAKDKTKAYTDMMKKVFKDENVFVIGIRNHGACLVDI